jgi:hypothetical protein
MDLWLRFSQECTSLKSTLIVLFVLAQSQTFATGERLKVSADQKRKLWLVNVLKFFIGSENETLII